MSGARESGLEVRLIGPEEREAWDAFVAASPQGTLFHTCAWQRTLEAAGTSDRWLLVGCFEGERLAGGCTALERLRTGIPMAVMPLLTPYGGYLLSAGSLGEWSGPLGSRDREILSTLARWMGERFRRESLITAPGLTDPRSLMESGYRVTPRFSFEIDLRLSEGELWGRLDGHVRRQVKKGERAGLEPCVPSAEEAFGLFRRTFERRGGRCPVPRALFEAVYAGEALQPFRDVTAVRHEGKLASLLVLLRYGRTLYYAVASTAPQAMATGASSWLIWQSLARHAGAAQGCTTFDFVGANIPSIARFKEGFNPILVPHWRLERARGLLGHALCAAAALRGR